MTEIDTDQDRFPVLRHVLHRILEDTRFAEQQVERIEVNLHATGEANYRLWPPRAEEPEIGYYPPEETAG